MKILDPPGVTEPLDGHDWSDAVEYAKSRLVRAMRGKRGARCSVRRADLDFALTQWSYDELTAGVCGLLRETANRVTGGNMAFADDDLMVLEHLAMRAVKAGLLDGLHSSIAAKAKALHGSGEAVAAQVSPPIREEPLE